MSLLIFVSSIFTLFTSFYDHSLQGINGTTINLNNYRGKKVLVVNIASGSSQVEQLAGLESLYQQHKDSLIVIAVPSNSFGKEPLDNQAIHQQLTATYSVHFLIATKSEVTGPSMLPLYQWLNSSIANGTMDTPVIGDFQKILVNGQGQIVGVFAHSEDPMGEMMQRAITSN
jgi:glutathione peroxidase